MLKLSWLDLKDGDEQTCEDETSHSVRSLSKGAPTMYRVTLVVEFLCLVDFDLRCSTILLWQ